MRFKVAVLALVVPVAPLAHNSYGQGFCFPPAEPPEISIDKKQEPELYEHVRSEFQIYLEEMEAYLRCLEQERKFGLERLVEINKQFLEKFGEDAVFKYSPK